MASQLLSIRNVLIAGILLISFAIPTLAHGAESAAARKIKAVRNVDATCMQTAVGVREDSLAVAFGEFHDALEAGLTERKSALHDAWGLDDVKERRAALKKAWMEWRKDSKAAHKEFRTERVNVWKTFKTAAKACGEAVPKEDATGADAKGEVTV